MRKFLMILLIGIICFGLIGCGKKSETNNNDTNEKKQNSESNNIIPSIKQSIDLTYKVCLKDSESCLDGNKEYVANLIDYIDIDFNYTFSENENKNYEHRYQVDAELIITAGNNNILYYKKDIIINQIQKSSKGNIFINENAKIDYDKYQNIAQDIVFEIERMGSISMQASLKVVFYVAENDLGESKVELLIPLSEQTITITKR